MPLLAILMIVPTISTLTVYGLKTLPTVSQVSLLVQGSLHDVYPEPPSTLLIPIENYADQNTIEVTLTLIIDNLGEHYLNWLYFSSFENPIISGVSASGAIGYQTEDQWHFSGHDQRLMLHADGGIDIKSIKTQPGKTQTIGLLAYGDLAVASTPLLTISVYLEQPETPDPEGPPKMQADAFVKKLELEINSEPENIDMTYYEGELLEAKLYFAEEDYELSLQVSSSALEKLRDTKEASEGFVPRLIRTLQAYSLLLVLPVVGLVAWSIFRRKNKNKHPIK